MSEVYVLIVCSDWTPPEVVRIASSIRAHAESADEIDLLKRLLNTPRMKCVWKELLAENRKTGGYLHPATGSALSSAGPEAAQNRACGAVLNLAYCAARDRIAVSKLPEVEAYRARLSEEAASFRQMADELAAKGVRTPEANADAAAALRMAQLKEEQVRRQLNYLRQGDDPLVITKERGDRVVRGVSAVIGAGLSAIYGKAMYSITATLTEVALGPGARSGVRAARTAATRALPRVVSDG